MDRITISSIIFLFAIKSNLPQPPQNEEERSVVSFLLLQRRIQHQECDSTCDKEEYIHKMGRVHNRILPEIPLHSLQTEYEYATVNTVYSLHYNYKAGQYYVYFLKTKQMNNAICKLLCAKFMVGGGEFSPKVINESI